MFGLVLLVRIFLCVSHSRALSLVCCYIIGPMLLVVFPVYKTKRICTRDGAKIKSVSESSCMRGEWMIWKENWREIYKLRIASAWINVWCVCVFFLILFWLVFIYFLIYCWANMLNNWNEVKGLRNKKHSLILLGPIVMSLSDGGKVGWEVEWNTKELFFEIYLNHYCPL